MRLLKKKLSKKETLIMYLKGVLSELEKTPSKAINSKNAEVMAKSIKDICK